MKGIFEHQQYCLRVMLGLLLMLTSLHVFGAMPVADASDAAMSQINTRQSELQAGASEKLVLARLIPEDKLELQTSKEKIKIKKQDQSALKRAKQFEQDSLIVAPKRVRNARMKCARGHCTVRSRAANLANKDYVRFLKLVISRAAKTHSVPPQLVWAVIDAESDFHMGALSKKGAIGLMQLMPRTAAAMGAKNPYDPVENVYAGTRYLKRLLDRYEGNKLLALAAYHAGPGNVRKYQGIPPFSSTRHYVKHVTLHYLEVLTQRL